MSTPPPPAAGSLHPGTAAVTPAVRMESVKARRPSQDSGEDCPDVDSVGLDTAAERRGASRA